MQSLTKPVVFIGVFVWFSLIPAHLFAADFYVAQHAAGLNNGKDVADAHSVSWLNNSGNWASPKQAEKIGPGDTVHLCGTISGDGTNAPIQIQASGSSGSPITILWETDAKVSTPACPAGELVLTNGNSYLLFNGGTNGIIENTDNGSALGNQLSVHGIKAVGGSNLEFENLTIQNLYVPNGSDTPPDCQGIFLKQCGSNISIHNCSFNYVSWAISLSGAADSETNFTCYDNTFDNYDHGIAACTGYHSGSIHDNDFGSTAIWDTSTNTWHHDAIHFWGTSVSNINIYNNYIHGNWGSNPTTQLYMEGSGVTDINIFNNILTSTGDLPDGYIYIKNGGNIGIYNNTFLGCGKTYAETVIANTSATVSFVNNLVTSVSTFFHGKDSQTFISPGLHNNLYANLVSSGNHPFYYQGTATSTIAGWQQLTGKAANSSLVSNAYLNSGGTLQSNSPAIGAGSNLTNLGITALNSDKNGNARPSSGAWNIGAYELATENNVPPSRCENLRIMP